MQVDKKTLVELRNATFAGFADCRDALIATNNNFDEAVKWLKEKGKIKAAKKQGAIAAEGAVKFFSERDEIGALIEVNSQTDFVAKNDNFTKTVDELLRLILKNKPKTVQEFNESNYGDEQLTIEEKLNELTARIGEKISIRRFEILEAGNGEFVSGYTHANKRVAAIALFKGNNEHDVVKNIMMNIVANNPVAVDKEHLDEKWLEQEFDTILKKTIEEGKPANMAQNIAKGRLNKQLEEICLVNEFLITNPEVKVAQYLQEHKLEVVKFVRYEVGEGIQKKEDNFVEEVNKQMRK